MLVYRLTNTANGKVYIGMTARTLKARWLEHCASARHGKGSQPITQAIRKYGRDSFTVETLYSAIDKDDMCAAEIRLIAEHNSTDRHAGYNLSHGGKGGTLGIKRSQEYCARASIRMIGFRHAAETLRKLSELKAGCSVSALTEGIKRAWADPSKRDAMTTQRRGRKWTEVQRVKMIQSRTGQKRGATAHTAKMNTLMAVECGPLHRTATVKRGNKIMCAFCCERAHEAKLERKYNTRLNKALWQLTERMAELVKAA